MAFESWFEIQLDIANGNYSTISGKQKKKAQTNLVSRQRVVKLDNTNNERSDFELVGKIEVSLVSLLVDTVLITRVV